MNRRETRLREFEDGATGLSIVDVITEKAFDKDGYPKNTEKEVEQYAELERPEMFAFNGTAEFFGFEQDAFCNRVEGRESAYGERRISIMGSAVDQGFIPQWEADNNTARLKTPEVNVRGYGGHIDGLRDHIKVLQAVLDAAEILDNDTGKVISWPDL